MALNNGFHPIYHFSIKLLQLNKEMTKVPPLSQLNKGMSPHPIPTHQPTLPKQAKILQKSLAFYNGLC